MLNGIEAAAARRRLSRRGVSPGTRPEPAMAMGSDCLPQIEHIVILMMENHSYDNYLGMMKGRGDGLPLGEDGEPDVVNTVPDGRQFHAQRRTDTSQSPGNPTQTWHASHIACNDGSCDGFSASVAATVP